MTTDSRRSISADDDRSDSAAEYTNSHLLSPHAPLPDVLCVKIINIFWTASLCGTPDVQPSNIECFFEIIPCM